MESWYYFWKGFECMTLAMIAWVVFTFTPQYRRMKFMVFALKDIDGAKKIIENERILCLEHARHMESSFRELANILKVGNEKDIPKQFFRDLEHNFNKGNEMLTENIIKQKRVFEIRNDNKKTENNK